MLRLQHIAVCTALITQSISFPGIMNAQISNTPFSPQILPCSYAACGFGEEDGSDQQSSSVDSLYAEASDARSRGNYAAEYRLYNKIIRLDPRAAQAYFNRADIKKVQMNDQIGALRDYLTAARIFREQGDNYMVEASVRNIQQIKEQ